MLKTTAAIINNDRNDACLSSTYSRLKAFTILELLISVAVIAIITTIAIPSFSSIIAKTETTTAALTLHTTLKSARNHALSNQVIVIVCQASHAEPSECHSERERYANWQNGWISYADLNQNNALDETDQIISSHHSNSQIAVIFNQAGRLRFFPKGSARSAGFYFCNKASQHTQYIRLLHTGRSRISRKLSASQRSKCQNQLKI